jgi:hypothetical protein
MNNPTVMVIALGKKVGYPSAECNTVDSNHY